MSDGLQAVLAGEYAVMYAYGRAGARLTEDRDLALAQLEVHRTRRDQLRAWLVEDGQAPLPPAPAYDVGQPVRGNTSARTLLATVELRLLPLFVELIAETASLQQRRDWAIRAVRDTAVIAQAWGAAGQAFPWPSGENPPL